MNLSVHVLNSTCGGFFYILFLKCIWTMVICTICLVHIFYNLDFFLSFLTCLIFVSFKSLDGMPCCLFFFLSFWLNSMLSLARCYMGWMLSTRGAQKGIFSYCFGMSFYLVKRTFKSSIIVEIYRLYIFVLLWLKKVNWCIFLEIIIIVDV